MQNIKTKIEKLLASATTMLMITSFMGCATLEENSEPETKTRIILSKDFDSEKDLSNTDRVGFLTAHKNVREAEAQKYYYDKEKQTYALKCFDSCGGAFIQKGKDYKYMPSKYEFNQNACLCNGQNILPHKEKENVELKLKACQQICESANTDKKQYTVDTGKTLPFSECVCKIVEENNQNKH